MTQTVPLSASLGAAHTGESIGYTVLALDRSSYSAFSTTGVAESVDVPGLYYVADGIVAPDAGGYVVVGVSGTDYAEAGIEPSAAVALAAYDPPTFAELDAGNAATLAAIAGIGSGTGAALNFAATEDNASAPIKGVSAVGTQTGTYANTLADDGTTHQLASVGNAIDWIYGFNCGAGRSASKFVFRSNMAATGDTVTVQAYNFSTTAWNTRTTITGTAETLRDIPLLSGHTGTGADEGKVYIRFVFAEADAGTLVIDEAYVQAQQSGSLIGYLDGLVWVDATAGTAGTTPYVNGTADNPCTTIADAYAIAAAVGLTGLHIAAGTTLTLTQSAAKWRFSGNGRLALNGQAIADAAFQDLYTVSGTSSGDDAFFQNCGVGDVTVEHAYFSDCRLKGTLTMVAAQAYFFIGCADTNESAAVQTFVFAANASAMFRDWHGGLQFNNMAATNEAIIDGASRVVLDASSVGGSVTVRGFAPALTGAAAFISAGGTITQDARYSVDAINAEVDTALADYDGPTNTEMEARTLQAADYVVVGDTIAGVTTVGTVTNPVTAGTVTDKTGYALTAVYDAAKTAATQTSVDDLPTNAELTTALGTADDAVLAAIAALNNLSSAGAQAAAAASLTAYGAALETTAQTILADTAELQTDWADGGRLDLLLDSAVAGSLDAAGVRAAIGMASANLDTQLADLPTVAELAAADDAVLAAVADVPTVAEFEARTLPAADYVVVGDTLAGVTTVGSVTTKTGYKLASDGLDSISTTERAGVASNFREMVVQTWRRFFKGAQMTATTMKTYDDTNLVVVTTQTVNDDGTTQIQGPAT